MPNNTNPKKGRLRSLPLRRLFPNMITLAAMCCGLMAIRFSLSDQWNLSVSFIVAAAVLDGMDGRIARLLNSTSTFGAQLDSLSDFLCFGVAPAFIMYQWNLHEIKGLGWAMVLFYAVCCALRLARFNTGLIEDTNAQPWKKLFFTGVPSPAGAMLCILPMVASFNHDAALLTNAHFNIAYVAIIGVLMASRIPTFSFKGGIRIRQDMVLPIMLLFVLFLVSFISEPWATFTVLMALYLVHIPASIVYYHRLERRG